MKTNGSRNRSKKHASISRAFDHATPSIDSFTHSIAISTPHFAPIVGVVRFTLALDRTSTLTYIDVPPSLSVDTSPRISSIVFKRIRELPIALQMDHEMILVKALKLHGN